MTSLCHEGSLVVKAVTPPRESVRSPHEHKADNDLLPLRLSFNGGYIAHISRFAHSALLVHFSVSQGLRSRDRVPWQFGQ